MLEQSVLTSPLEFRPGTNVPGNLNAAVNDVSANVPFSKSVYFTCLQQFYSYKRGIDRVAKKIIKDVLSQFTKNKIGI